MHTINSLAVSKLKTYTHQPTGGRRHIKCIINPYIHTQKNNSVTLHLKRRNVMFCKCRKFIIHIMIKDENILQNSIPSWVEGHQRAFSIPRNRRLNLFDLWTSLKVRYKHTGPTQQPAPTFSLPSHLIRPYYRTF